MELTDTDRFHRNEVIRSFKSRLREKSENEARHATRVAVYAVAMGSELGLPDEDLLYLRYAAELHDIGKLGFPPDLFSRRRLNGEEEESIRAHTRAGVEILTEYPWLSGSLSSILSHHERWDGAGYPDRLRETQIPFGARLIAVAETFDSMTMAVDWRDPISEKEALADIVECSEKQLDPDVVRAFLKIQPIVQPVGL